MFYSIVPANSIYYSRFVKISLLLTCETRRYCSEIFVSLLKVWFILHFQVVINSCGKAKLHFLFYGNKDRFIYRNGINFREFLRKSVGCCVLCD